MDILKEQLLRTKELMGIINEQGSGSAAPESFTGSGKSCIAGDMWSEEEEDCVRMDFRYIDLKMRNSRELHDLEDELRNDNTMEVMIKNTIEGLYRWQQSRKSEDLKDVKVYDVWKREVKDKLENDIRKYRKDVTNRFINSEAVTKVLSVLDEKTRELIIKEFIMQDSQWNESYYLKKIEQDVINYIKHYIGDKDGVEKFIMKWKRQWKIKPYIKIRGVKLAFEDAIKNNL